MKDMTMKKMEDKRSNKQGSHCCVKQMMSSKFPCVGTNTMHTHIHKEQCIFCIWLVALLDILNIHVTAFSRHLFLLPCLISLFLSPLLSSAPLHWQFPVNEFHLHSTQQFDINSGQQAHTHTPQVGEPWLTNARSRLPSRLVCGRPALIRAKVGSCPLKSQEDILAGSKTHNVKNMGSKWKNFGLVASGWTGESG